MDFKDFGGISGRRFSFGLLASALLCWLQLRFRQAIKSERHCNYYNPPAVWFTPHVERKLKMKTKNIRKAGFTLVEIMIVVAIIGLLAAIAIPNFVRARTTSQANACINNLRQIDAAKNEWALEKGQQTGAAVASTDISPYIKLNASNSIPGCPAGGTYTIGNVGSNPTCNIGNSTSPAHALP